MDNKHKWRNIDKVTSVFIVVLLVCLLWYFVFSLPIVKKFIYNSDFLQKYEFTSPLLKYNNVTPVDQTIRPFYKSELEVIVNWYLKESSVKNISLYFRDLNNWFVFWINERDLFVPASLTKVPTLMAVLKKSENDSLLLNKKIKIKNLNFNFVSYYPPFLTVKNNNEYSVEDLLNYMIKYSDNWATSALWEILSWYNITYKDVYSDLKIEFSWDFVEVVDYSALFRVLFNSSYLNKNLSEYALYVLSQVNFEKWLRKYLPSDIVVSHKFWEFAFDPIIKQLHDCWIIYYPNHPYVLCIMSRWDNYGKLEDVIWNISKYIFDKVNITYWNNI